MLDLFIIRLRLFKKNKQVQIKQIKQIKQHKKIQLLKLNQSAKESLLWYCIFKLCVNILLLYLSHCFVNNPHTFLNRLEYFSLKLFYEFFRQIMLLNSTILKNFKQNKTVFISLLTTLFFFLILFENMNNITYCKLSLNNYFHRRKYCEIKS